ncbi:MAG: iron-sulfur cluster assembly accessory protein [Acidobacteriia bacterium]|nr:iron-sulfur cluster assembly accessory protein [Terriglobia bacterium]
METTTAVQGIQLTPSAVTKVKDILAKQPETFQGLRIAVVGGGCSGFQYHMGFEKASGLNDQVLNFDGLNVIVDNNSLQYLKGCEVDYVEGLHGTGFKFNNPNAVSTCGCGESFKA